ncbi:hypothetical protein, partial [Pseudonocardia sp.]|uniref:hypothetical protein n=1 Tax=Pseudonocardia sp. TaxID=60912 RepID=UPI002607C70F
DDMTVTQAECVAVNTYAGPEAPGRDELTRLAALDLAIAAREQGEMWSNIVLRAETFRAFIAGDGAE